jgi:hypothetical protein
MTFKTTSERLGEALERTQRRWEAQLKAEAMHKAEEPKVDVAVRRPLAVTVASAGRRGPTER